MAETPALAATSITVAPCADRPALVTPSFFLPRMPQDLRDAAGSEKQ